MLSDINVLIGTVVGIIAVVVSILGFVSVQSKNLRDGIAAGDKGSIAEAEKLVGVEAKARHAHANNVQITLNRMEADIKALDREAVRKEDLDRMSAQWQTTLSRFEAKVDRVSEQVSHLAALEQAFKNCVERLAEITKRLDSRENSRGA